MWCTFAYFYPDFAPFGYPFATKNALLSTDKSAFFLNDVCLRKMMLALPDDVRFANDVCLAVHWANIASLAERSGATSYLRCKFIISPSDDALFSNIFFV